MMRAHTLRSRRRLRVASLWVAALMALGSAVPPARAQSDTAPSGGRVVGVITADLPPGRPIQIALARRHSDFLQARPVRSLTVPGPGPFLFPDVPPGAYAIVAFIDFNGNGVWDWEVDAYAVRRERVVVEADADSEPVIFDAFANGAPTFPLPEQSRAQLLAQVRFLDQAVVALESAPETPAVTRRRASTLRYRLRNVMQWAPQPGTREQHRFLFAEVAAVAGAYQTLAQGGDPEAGERGAVRRAVLSPTYGSHWPYALYVPHRYDPARTWPLFVVLHGAGGNADTMLRTVCGAGPWGWRVLPGREPFPPFPERAAFVLSPYGLTTRDPFDGYKASAAEVMAAIDAVQADYTIDPRQTYLLGVSMGGGGAWRLGLTHPDRFAAIAPVSGTLPLPLINAGDAPNLPVLVVHGALDHVIPIADVRRYVAQRRRAHGRVELRELADSGHLLEDFALADLFADLEAAAATRAW